MLQYQVVIVTAFHQNCSIIWCDKKKEAALIDPGGDAELLKEAVSKLNVNVKKILITHAHLDHVGAAVELAEHYGVKIVGSSIEDEFLFNALPEQCLQFSAPYIIKPFLPDQWLKEGDKIELGDVTLEVLHCPGHTPGHIVFIDFHDKIAFVGDVLFNRSIGRTDLPGGNYHDLITSINSKLLTLDGEMAFVAGHGAMSTFGDEKKTNPFLL